jgi:hypothetical protein
MIQQRREPFPRPKAALTAPPQREPPVPRDFLPERMEPRRITRHSMVLEVPTDDPFQPLPGVRNGLMHPPTQFHPDTPEFRPHPLAHRLTMHRELAAFMNRAANMREAQKIERLWFPLPFPLPVRRRETPELKQASLVRVQFQPLVRQALPQLLPKPLGLPPVLKP